MNYQRAKLKIYLNHWRTTINILILFVINNLVSSNFLRPLYRRAVWGGVIMYNGAPRKCKLKQWLLDT